MVSESVVPFRRREELDIRTMAEVFAESGFFADSHQAAQCVTKILAGRELGIPAIAAMTGIYLVKGRITLSANLMGALIKRSGRYDFRVRRLDNEACTIAFTERGEPIGESSFTKEDAIAAGLWGSETWKHYPRNMLYARALSNGARWYTPDIFGGGPVYMPEELGAALDPDSGEPVIDLHTGEVVDESVERPPALIKALSAWHEVAVRAQANGIEPAERDFDTATADELRASALSLHKLLRAATQLGWPQLIADALALGLDPPPLPELATPRILRARFEDLAGRLAARKADRDAETPAAPNDEPDEVAPF